MGLIPPARPRRSPQRLVRPRRVPPHHPLCLPTAERHHNRRREALVERHRRSVVPQIMDVKVAEPGRPGGFAEDAADVLAAVWAPVRAGKGPLAAVSLELLPEDLARGLAEDHRPRARLRLGQEHDALLEVDGLTPEEPDLAEPHQRQRRELRDLPERRRHRLEDQELLLRPDPADACLVLPEEGPAGEPILGARLLQRGAKSPEVTIDRARLVRHAALALLTVNRLDDPPALTRPSVAEDENLGVADRTHRLVEPLSREGLQGAGRGLPRIGALLC